MFGQRGLGIHENKINKKEAKSLQLFCPNKYFPETAPLNLKMIY